MDWVNRPRDHLSREFKKSPILQITGLRKEFGSTVALKDITFSVTEGEFIVILGRSGAGKPALIR
jgi:ABC-type Fe3+/spermidine/putrescine transport system ATPase subunit